MNPAPAALAAVICLLTAATVPAAAAPAPASAGAPATAGEAPALRHIVQPGETLQSIALKALTDPDDWRALARVNAIADPARLATGSTVLIPSKLLRREPVEAAIVAFSGAVKVEGDKARLGQAVAAGDVISTGANSFVTLALGDGSRVTLPSQSRIRIEALDRIVLDGRLERRFRLESGRGEFNVAPRQHPDDRFLVRTPVAVAAVRGTEFDIDTDGSDSIITVDEGVISSRPLDDDAETLLPAGRAALLDADVQRQVAMLPRPALTPQSRVGRGADTLDLVIAPDSAPGHHIVLARDAGFVDQYAEAETATNSLSFADVPDGIVYARVRGVDAEGVAGLAADYAAVRGTAPAVRPTRFRWQRAEAGDRRYDLVVARDPQLSDRVLEIEGLDATEFTAEGLASGIWYWRVTGRPAEGTSGRVHVHPVRQLTIVPLDGPAMR